MRKIYKLMLCLLSTFIFFSSFQISDVWAKDKDITVVFEQSYDEANKKTDIVVKPQAQEGFTISGIQKQDDIRFNEIEKTYTVKENGEYVFLVYYKDIQNKEQSEEFVVTVDTIEEELKTSTSDNKEEEKKPEKEELKVNKNETHLFGVASSSLRTLIPTDTKYFVFGSPNTITGYSSSTQATKDIVIPETYVDSNGVTQEILHIGNNAFEGQQLRSITLNNNLKTIGNSSLANNPLITQINIPDSVTSLGDSVFNGCSQLASVELGEGITSIPDSCFADTGLITITIPDTVTSIGFSAFSSCYQLTSVEFGKGITTIGDYCFNNSGLKSITIPDTVTSLGSAAFSYCRQLTSIKLGSRITSVPGSCFMNTGLTSITIPDTVTSIENSAFSRCYQLISMELGTGITSIPDSCFADTGLISITIPDTVTSIGDSAFSSCSQLTSMELGKGITSIPDYCFRNTGLTSLVVPDTVTNLGVGAFSECNKLTSVELGEGITSIPDGCFSGTGLTSIAIPDTVKSLGRSAFSRCSQLSSIELGKDITSIPELCFSDTGLTNVTIPDAVTSLGRAAFRDCQQLTRIKLGKGITNIGEEAFFNIDNSLKIDLLDKEINEIVGQPWGAANVEIYWKSNDSSCYYENDGTVFGFKPNDHPNHVNCIQNGDHTYIDLTRTINGNKVKIIAPNSFEGIRKLTIVKLGTGITSIPDSCFADTGLISITIPDTVTSIGDSAFSSCSQLTSMELGKGITSIPDYCFRNTGLTSLVIPDTVTNLGVGAFSECNKLTSVELGEGITSIPDWCFSGTGLTNIAIPDTVKSLGRFAFSECNKLTSVELGEGITSIPDWCFSGTGLTNIAIPDTVTSLGGYAFSNCAQLSSVELGKGITSIPDWCFSGTGLTSIVIPDTVTSIGNNAFSNCAQLSSAELGEGITSISFECFRNARLTSITIPDTVLSLGRSAFSGCNQLASVELGKGITSIPYQCFSGTGLTSITIPDTLTYLEDDVFSYTNLTDIQLPSSIIGLHEAAFKNTSIDTIYINQVRDACSYKGSQPWGAKPDAKVLYKGEFIDGRSTLMYSDDLSKAKFEHDIKAEAGGYIKKVVLPNGKVVDNIDQENYKLEWEALKNEEYSFSVTSSYGNTRVFKVPINNIEYIKLEANNGIIPSNMVDEITEEGIIDKTNAHSLLNYNKERLEVSVVHPTIEEVKSELSKKRINEVTVTLKSEGKLPNDSEVLTETKKVKLRTSESAYEVKFLDFDKNVLKTDYVYAGEDGIPPTKVPEKKGYLFMGWEKTHQDVQDDVEVNALFEKEKYKVTFKGYEGNILKEEEVPYQENATAPKNPNQKGYTFLGWDKPFTNIEENIVVNGKYSINTYKVTFKDYEGNILKEEEVLFQEDAIAPSVPSLKGHTFTGWDKSYTNVEEEIVVTAKYSKNSYKVTFNNYDGTELKKEDVLFQEDATAPKIPFRKGYTFTGWDKSLTNVEEDIVVTAKYTIDSYKVTFKDHEGNVLKEEEVLFQEDAAAPSAPILDGYTFIGWSKKFESIEANSEIKAVYKAYPKWIGKDKFEIEIGASFNANDYSAFEDADGNNLKEYAVITINTVDVNKAGKYEIVYTVEDKWGATSEKHVVVLVKEKVVENKPDSTLNDVIFTGDQSNSKGLIALLILSGVVLFALRKKRVNR